MDYDVVVVGAGPAGSVTARDLGSAGYRTLLLEEHSEVGKPVHCSGLVTSRTLEAAGVGEEIVVNRIRGAIVHTPSGEMIKLGGDRTRALVIDRCRFDQILAEQAQEAGATLATDTRLVSLEHMGDRVRVRLRRGGNYTSIDTRLVIGGDGSRSMVARKIGLPTAQEAILAMGGEIDAEGLDPHLVEVFARPDLAPGWFGWTIPVGNRTSRIGIGSSDWRLHPRHLLERLTGQFEHLRARSFLRVQGGVIPVRPLHRVYGSGALLVGDAAGQVKPTSGGGIYTSVVSARLCAAMASQALEEGDLSDHSLARYQAIWMERLGVELLRSALLRCALTMLTPSEIDAFLRLFAIDAFRQVTLQDGDIDFPARLFTRLFRPGLILRSLTALSPPRWIPLLRLAFEWYRLGIRFPVTTGSLPGMAQTVPDTDRLS